MDEIADHLFEYADYDIIDELEVQYTTCVLKQPIGLYPVGSQVATILLSLGEGVLYVYETEDSETADRAFALRVNVGEEIPMEDA